MSPLSHDVQWHPILYDRKSASLVAKSTRKLNRAQIGGGLQVPMAVRATESEHIVIRHVVVVFLENGRSAHRKHGRKALNSAVVYATN
jgi:hypothetical protein